MKALAVVCVSALVVSRVEAGTEPLSTEVRLVACAEGSDLVSEAGVCYVYDLVTKQKTIEVSVAAGLKVDAGVLVAGAEAKAMIEVVVAFPLGTKQEDAVKAAHEVLKKQLSGRKVRSELKELGLEYERVGRVKKALYCEREDEMTLLLKKALGEAAEDVQ